MNFCVMCNVSNVFLLLVISNVKWHFGVIVRLGIAIRVSSLL